MSIEERKYFKATPKDLEIGHLLYGSYEHFPFPPNCEPLIEEITKEEYEDLIK